MVPLGGCERWDSLHYSIDSIEPEPSKCPPDTCIELFESHLEHKNIGHPVRGSRYFGASVLIGLFEKESDTNGF